MYSQEVNYLTKAYSIGLQHHLRDENKPIKIQQSGFTAGYYLIVDSNKNFGAFSLTLLRTSRTVKIGGCSELVVYSINQDKYEDLLTLSTYS